jgi:DNA-directed RNA polymerase subunit M/transcription elongation factor TFIIS
MSNGDPAAEWRRLEELYRKMSDDELQVVADEAYELTDVARDVLQREIASRGVEIVLRKRPAPPEPEPDEDPQGENFDPSDFELVSAARVWDREEALRYKRIFKEAGIASFLGPDLAEKVYEYEGDYSKGVEFKVCDVDYQRAMAAIRWAFRDEPPPPQEEEADSVDYRCPKCHSGEIVFEELERESPDQPDYLSKFNWHCDACGHEWTDDGVEKEA